MTERAKKYLYDIEMAAERIERYTQPTGSLAAYESADNEMARAAVERQLAIIGEAVNHYRREPGSVILTDTVQIIKLRNVLIHSYDVVHNPTIWAVIQENLPSLRAEVAALLAT